MTLQAYIMRLIDQQKSDAKNRTNLFEPKINDAVITSYYILDEYKRIKKEKEMHIPTFIKAHKNGEHCNSMFLLDSTTESASLLKIIESKNYKDVTIDEENGVPCISISY